MNEFMGATKSGNNSDAGRILLVGENNPLSTAPEHALFCYPEGCSGHRLQEKIFGLPREQYLALWRTNLCVGGFSLKKARERARILLSEPAPWKVIVMLGRKVEEAFGTVYEDNFCGPLEGPWLMHYFETRQVLLGKGEPEDGTVVSIVSLPHPSGRNRAWSVQGTIGTARKVMSELSPSLSWGTI